MGGRRSGSWWSSGFHLWGSWPLPRVSQRSKYQSVDWNDGNGGQTCSSPQRPSSTAAQRNKWPERQPLSAEFVPKLREPGDELERGWNSGWGIRRRQLLATWQQFLWGLHRNPIAPWNNRISSAQNMESYWTMLRIRHATVHTSCFDW